jgi:alkyl hydroperoxide reductase subunit AhpC
LKRSTTSAPPSSVTPVKRKLRRTVLNTLTSGREKVKPVLVYRMTTGRTFDEVLQVIDAAN